MLPAWKRWLCFNMQAQVLKPQALLLLLTSIGLIMLPHSTNLPVTIIAFFTFILIWRLLAIRNARLLANSRLILLVSLLGILLLFYQFSGGWSLEMGVAIFIMAFTLKLLELNTPRDAYVLGYAAFIVIATLFLYSQTIAILVYSLILSGCLLAAMLAFSANIAPNKSAFVSVAILIVQALPLAAVIFFAFPRFPAPKWMQINSHRNLSGLSETLEPGAMTELFTSQELVFRVKFKGDSPPRQALYWRGPVLSYTDGRTWRVLHTNFAQYLDQAKTFGPTYDYTELLEPQEFNWVYALDIPVQYDENKLQRNGYYQLTTLHKQSKAAEYELVSSVNYNTGYITKTEYKESLQLAGEPTQRLVELVKKLKGFSAPPEEFIAGLLQYYRDQHFVYTLSPPAMGGSPIENFLFEAKSGFCVHYASSFVYLMRVAGIPARIVTGYYGGELNSIGEFLEIRQANAHAWAEVWLENKGWIRVDPTSAILLVDNAANLSLDNVLSPTNTNNHSLLYSSLQKMQQVWHNVDYQWQRWIIHYGEHTQSQILMHLGISNLTQLILWIAAAFSLLILILVLYILRVRKNKLEPAVRVYQQYCKKLAKAGLVIQSGEGALDFALRARLKLPRHAQQIIEITQLYIRLRYERVSDEQDLILLKLRVKELQIKLDGTNI
jgi:transglutaminase-like putative cysteine protease